MENQDRCENKKPLSFMPGLAAGAAVFFVVLLILVFNAAPSVTFHDSGELALAAATAGIPHPPGAPTWTSLASLFVRVIPISDPARATNLFSALCGALTIALSIFLAFIWISSTYLEILTWKALIAALIPSVMLLHSPAFLEQSFTTEQYTLMTLLIVLMLLCTTFLLRVQIMRCQLMLSMVLGVLYGLAIGNHLSSLALCVLILPSLVIRVYSPQKMWRDISMRFVNLFLATSFGLFIGLLIFIWVPLRSLRDPLMDWGNVETLDRLWWAISRKQWETRPLADIPSGFVMEWILSYNLFHQLGIPGFVALCAGIIALVKKNKILLLFLFAVSVPYAAGMLFAHMRQKGLDINYIRHYGVQDWHLPLYLAGSLLGSMGFAAVLNQVRHKIIYMLMILLFVIMGFSAVMAIHTQSLQDFKAPERFINAVLAPLPDDAIIVVTSDNCAYMLSYNRYARNTNSCRSVTYALYSAPRAIQNAIDSGGVWNEDVQEHYLRNILMEPENSPLNLPRMDSNRARTGRLFVEYDPRRPATAAYMLPAGFLMEILHHRTTDDEILMADESWEDEYASLLPKCSDKAHRLEREAWSLLFERRAAFFYHRGLLEKAAESYEHAVQWIPTNADYWFVLGDIYERQKNFPKAQYAYEMSIQQNPYLCGPRLNLAILHARNRNYDRAEDLLEEELRLSPDDPDVRHNLKLVIESRNKGQ